MKAKKVISPFKRMMNKIRKLPQYISWRNKVLANEFLDNPIPKGTQVHHTTNFSKLLKENNINSISEAIKCKTIWDAEGICLSRGEHFLLTRISLYKYPSRGFIMLLAAELERLQLAQFDKRPERRNGIKAHRKSLLEKRELSSNNRECKKSAKRNMSK